MWPTTEVSECIPRNKLAAESAVSKSTFKIEKNIPFTACSKYPLADMEVGDSFFVPDFPNEGKYCNVKRMCAAIWTYRLDPANNAKKFTARTVCGGVRVWRVR